MAVPFLALVLFTFKLIYTTSQNMYVTEAV